MHIRLCGRVSDKKIFTRPISRNKTTFYLALLRISANILNENILNECTKKKKKPLSKQQVIKNCRDPRRNCY